MALACQGEFGEIHQTHLCLVLARQGQFGEIHQTQVCLALACQGESGEIHQTHLCLVLEHVPESEAPNEGPYAPSNLDELGQTKGSAVGGACFADQIQKLTYFAKHSPLLGS